jgi:NADPH-dependent 2,4-dienoyl-CoA reductase/sulfur reductase-like enzyme
MSSTDRIVVVGSSLAGVRSVEAIRRAGFSGAIVLVGAEKHYPPIDRPPLSKKFLQSSTAGDAVRVDVELEVDLRLGQAATSLDLARRQVQISDGSTLDYDGLLVATGSTVRHLPGTANDVRRTNVHVLRTVDDAAALRATLVPGARIAIIGAGVLGCEIAATCRQLELDVTLIDVFDEPMLRILGRQVAPLLSDLHRQHGVHLELHREVLGIRGTEDRAEGVLLDHDEVVEADVFVVAIGAFPETRWLESSGLELADGVVCDSECFAIGGDRRIVAAGDVARWHHRLLGRSLRVEHWTNAVAQGQVAGRNLVARLGGDGELTAYDALPYFWTDQYDWKIQFLGVLGDEIRFEEGEPGARQFVVSYHVDGSLVGALCVNRPSRLAFWRNAITAALLT